MKSFIIFLHSKDWKGISIQRLLEFLSPSFSSSANITSLYLYISLPTTYAFRGHEKFHISRSFLWHLLPAAVCKRFLAFLKFYFVPQCTSWSWRWDVTFSDDLAPPPHFATENNGWRTQIAVHSQMYLLPLVYIKVF